MKLIMDIETRTWSYDASDIDHSSEYIDFYFSFKDEEAKTVQFNNLRFGYFLVLDSGEVVNEEYPKGNVVYLDTDQEYLEVSRVFGFRPNRSYDIEFWAEDSGIMFFENATFTIPIPPQPFNSWTWDDEIASWVAPVEYPSDGNMYHWDEVSQEWILSVLN